MSAQALTNVQLFFGSMELSQFSGSFDQSQTTAMKEANNFAAAGYTVVVPGISSFGMNVQGNADFATGGVSQTFTPAQRGTQYGAGIVYAGSAAVAGDAATFTQGVLEMAKYASGAVGEVAQFELALTSDTAMVNGAVGAVLASRTTAGLTGTAVAMTGPTASQKLYAGLYVTAAAGTNLAVKIQTDDNSGFSSATDRITFSTVSATGWQFSSVAGSFSSETHVRVVATVATSTFSFAVLVGVL